MSGLFIPAVASCTFRGCDAKSFYSQAAASTSLAFRVALLSYSSYKWINSMVSKKFCAGIYNDKPCIVQVLIVCIF